MRKIFLSLLLTLLLLPALPVQAQPPSPRLSPYEELRYGSDLSQVPREPYRSESRLEGYQARPYIPPAPESAVRPGAASRKRSVPDAPASAGRRDYGLKSPQSKARDRYQTRAVWRNEQRKISERSRIPAPQAPLLSAPPGQPSLNPNRR